MGERWAEINIALFGLFVFITAVFGKMDTTSLICLNIWLAAHWLDRPLEVDEDEGDETEGDEN